VDRCARGRCEGWTLEAFPDARHAEPLYGGRRDTISAIKKAVGNPKYTKYPDVGHNCWEDAYAPQEFWDWLLEQNGNEKQGRRERCSAWLRLAAALLRTGRLSQMQLPLRGGRVV
jgi:hypothetical protein